MIERERWGKNEKRKQVKYRELYNPLSFPFVFGCGIWYSLYFIAFWIYFCSKLFLESPDCFKLFPCKLLCYPPSLLTSYLFCNLAYLFLRNIKHTSFSLYLLFSLPGMIFFSYVYMVQSRKLFLSSPYFLKLVCCTSLNVSHIHLFWGIDKNKYSSNVYVYAGYIL